MMLETKVILPAAQKYLTAEDWAEMSHAFAQNGDPRMPGTDIVRWGFAIDAYPTEHFTGLMERVVDGPQQRSWQPGLTTAMDLRGQKVEMLEHRRAEQAVVRHPGDADGGEGRRRHGRAISAGAAQFVQAAQRRRRFSPVREARERNALSSTLRARFG